MTTKQTEVTVESIQAEYIKALEDSRIKLVEDVKGAGRSEDQVDYLEALFGLSKEATKH